MHHLLRLLSNNKVQVFCSRVLGAGIVLLLQIIVFKIEKSSISGVFFISYTLFQIMNVLCRFGADVFIVRNYNQLNYRLKRAEVSASFFSSLILSFPCVVIFILIGYCFAVSWFGVDSIPVSTYAIFSIGILLPITSSSSIIYYIYQAKNKVVIQTLGLNVAQPFIFLILYVMLSFSFKYFDSIDSIIPLVFSFYLSAIICFYISLFASKKINYPMVFSNEMFKLSFHKHRANINKHFIMSTAGTQVIGWLPYLLSSFILGPTFAAIFNMVQRFAMVDSFISISINSVSSPFMAKMLKEQDWRGIVDLIKKNTLFLVSSSALYGAICIGYMSLFGYFENKWMLLAAIIIVFGYTINCGTSVCGYYFQIIANVAVMNKVIYTIIIIIPLLTIVLSRLMGAIGASISIFLAVTMVNIILFPMMIFHAKRNLKKLRSTDG